MHSLLLPTSCAALILIASALLPLTPAGAAPTVRTLPEFDLPRWNDPARVKRADFAGQILVLDFFAYWCAPCKAASQQLESGIQRHYAQAGGNPAGVPVRVLGVNIEKDNPKLTAQFIQQAGAHLVAQDLDGALLAQLGGTATPFIVIIDGTRADTAGFRIVYQRAGFEGAKKLRAIIDAIQPPPPDERPRPDECGSEGEVEETEQAEPAAAVDAETAVVPDGPPVAHKPEGSFEALFTGDILLLDGALRYGEKRSDTEWSLAYRHSDINLEYEPFAAFDFLGFPTDVREKYDSLLLAGRLAVGPRWTVTAAAGVYQGFTDYRSVWLNTYYEQQYSFFPEFTYADPQGVNVAAGLRWEYQAGTGFAEVTMGYAYDQIAPGWEMDPGTGELLRGRELLNTYSPTVKFENILTPRVRTLHEVQLTWTSGREVRAAYRGSLNWAIGEHWVARFNGGYTREEPTFDAFYGGATLERELSPRWLVSVSGRYYSDTGEIENSTLLSSAAPGLDSWQIGLGLRYVGDRSSFKIFIAPQFADYAPITVGTRPFTNLYQDRTWGIAQFAWAMEF